MSAIATSQAFANEPQVSSVSLLARARSLQAQSARVNPLVAGAYRRRAAELRMEAWARAARRSPAPLDAYASPSPAAA